MSLANNLREYVAACFTGLWIQSHEYEDALAEIAQLCRDEDWRLATWDVAQGLQVAGLQVADPQASEQNGMGESDARDPLSAIRSINALATPTGTALLVLTNFHRFLNSAEIVQT
ncbi:MAG: AAA family ATPase, partial [Planctomycetales bacterium]|nr:AAA family ATPase [Planctomycetales bacterium]